MGMVWEIGTERLLSDAEGSYYRRLKTLTAEKWLAEAEDAEYE